MKTLSGYRIRPLIFSKDTGGKTLSITAFGNIVAIRPYDDGQYQVVRQGSGATDTYAVASLEEAIKLCNAWNENQVMTLLEEI